MSRSVGSDIGGAIGFEMDLDMLWWWLDVLATTISIRSITYYSADTIEHSCLVGGLCDRASNVCFHM